MATESDLRDLLRGPEPEGSAGIDLESVIRRTRARRRPRIVAAGTLGAFALAGALTPVVVFSLPTQQATFLIAEDGAGGSAPEAGDTALARATAASLNLCAAPLAEAAGASASSGLILEVTPLTADAKDPNIPVDVVLRNDGTTRVVGRTASGPIVTLSSAGGSTSAIVLWHTNGAMDADGVAIDLGPGESMTFTTTFEPVVCAAEDDAEGFRDDLPAVGPGSYLLSAAIDFSPGDGTTGPVLVTGPPARVHLTG